MTSQNPVSAGPHAPDTSPRLKRWLGPFYVTGVFWYRLHFFGATRTPRFLPRLILPFFTLFFFFALRRIRNAVASNLEVVLGPCGFWQRQGRIWRSLYGFSWCLTERYEQFAPNRPIQLQTEGFDHWQRLLDGGSGFILLTGHIGNWEAASALPASRNMATIHLVREPEGNPEAQAFIADILQKHGGDRYRTHFAAEDPSLALALLAALRRGEVVALQGDRPRQNGRQRTVSLFDRPFPLPEGTVTLARHGQAPILPVFVFRTGRLQYRLVFRKPIPVEEGGEQKALDAFASELEWAIRQAPYQWFCFRELWPKVRS